MMLLHFFNGSLTANGRRPSAKRPRVRLTLEALEDRVVPADNQWTNATGGFLWSTPANWATVIDPTDQHVPSGVDYVLFRPTSTIPGSGTSSVVDGAFSFDRFNDDPSYNATLFVPWLDIGVSGASITTNNSIEHYGWMELHDHASINAGYYYLTGGTIAPNEPLVINTNNFDDGGTIHVKPGGVLTINTGAFTQLPSTSIVVDHGGALIVNASNQLNIMGSATIINDGGYIAFTSPHISIDGTIRTFPGPLFPLDLMPPVPAVTAHVYINEHGIVGTAPVLDVPKSLGAAAMGPLPTADFFGDGIINVSDPRVAGGTFILNGRVDVNPFALIELHSTTLTVNGSFAEHQDATITLATPGVTTLQLNTGSSDAEIAGTINLVSTTYISTQSWLHIEPTGVINLHSAGEEAVITGNIWNNGAINWLEGYSDLRMNGDVYTNNKTGADPHPGVLNMKVGNGQYMNDTFWTRGRVDSAIINVTAVEPLSPGQFWDIVFAVGGFGSITLTGFPWQIIPPAPGSDYYILEIYN